MWLCTAIIQVLGGKAGVGVEAGENVLCYEFEISLGYMTSCLQNKKKAKGHNNNKTVSCSHCAFCSALLNKYVIDK